MNIWGLAGAAVIGGVAVASAGVLTGVIEVPYSIQIAPKNQPAPAPEPVAEAPQAEAETPVAPPVAQPAKPVPVAEAAPPPRPRPRPVTAQPIPVASAPYRANQPTGDIDYFFDALAPYGQWVADRSYGYVFVPDRRGAGWRPYQEGQWVWTDDYGWYWQSNEPFGWATYHYGRWDYGPDFGWFWVPGDVWSPAWVTFRTGGGSVGWAPVAPDRQGYAYGMPRRYQPPVAESWVFVDQRAFGGADIGRRAAPIDQIGDYLGRAQDVRRPRWQDGRFYNEPVGRPSQPSREIIYVDRQDDIFEDNRGGRIGVFRPQIDDGNFNRRPDRYVNDVPREDRSLIRQFVPQSGSGTDAVSAALLSVLAPAERQTLDDSRQQDGGAWQAEINRLNAEKAALVEQQRQAAASRQVEIDTAVKKAEADRQAQQDQLRKEREARAQSVLEKVAAEPKPQPPAGQQQPPQPDQPQPPRAEPPAPAPAEPAPPPPAAPAEPNTPPPAEAAPPQPAPAQAPEPAPAKPKPPKREKPVEQPATEPKSPPPAAEPVPQPEAAPPAEEPPAKPKRQKPAEEFAPPQQPEAVPPAEPAPQPEAVPRTEGRPARPKRQRPPEQAAPQPEAPATAAEPSPSLEPSAPAAEPAPQPEPAPPAEEPPARPKRQKPPQEAVPQPAPPAPAAEPAPQPGAAPPAGEVPRGERPPKGERGGERPNRHGPGCPEGMAAQPDGSCAAP